MNERLNASATAYDEVMPSQFLRASVAQSSETVDRLIYASEASIGGSVFDELELIRQAALRHNPPLGICTALLYQSGWFMQWKEGPRDAILHLMKRVSKDSRHRNLRTVHASRGPRLLSGPWSMVVVQSHEDSGQMAERVRWMRENTMLTRHYSPAAAWVGLCTPTKHLSTAHKSRSSDVHLVLVCSAFGTLSFELVQWLAQQHSQELTHRRLSGEHDLDVASDLVDFVDGVQPMRVIAMARKGLRVPLARALLSDFSDVLLLLSGDEDRDVSLGLKVTSACRHLAKPPRMIGIARFATWHAPLMAIARRDGLEYLACQEQSHKPQALWGAALHAGLTKPLLQQV